MYFNLAKCGIVSNGYISISSLHFEHRMPLVLTRRERSKEERRELGEGGELLE